MLPVSAMSRATATDAGSSSCLIIWSMIRMFAWCGTNAPMSAGATPASAIALAATGAIWNAAHLNTL